MDWGHWVHILEALKKNHRSVDLPSPKMGLDFLEIIKNCLGPTLLIQITYVQFRKSCIGKRGIQQSPCLTQQDYAWLTYHWDWRWQTSIAEVCGPVAVTLQYILCVIPTTEVNANISMCLSGTWQDDRYFSNEIKFSSQSISSFFHAATSGLGCWVHWRRLSSHIYYHYGYLNLQHVQGIYRHLFSFLPHSFLYKTNKKH